MNRRRLVASLALVLGSFAIAEATVSLSAGAPGQAAAVSDVDTHKAFGSKNAPITMEVFSDYQCPACKQLYKTTNQQLLDNYVNASKVYLIHRRSDFRASKIMIDRARANEKIEFVTPAIVEEILGHGNGAVDGVRLRNPDTNEIREIKLDGVFVAIGHTPNSTVFKGKIEMDANGYLLASSGSKTTVPGVFVAGDVQDHRYRQAVTAAGSGCMAALDAEKFIDAQQEAERVAGFEATSQQPAKAPLPVTAS